MSKTKKDRSKLYLGILLIVFLGFVGAMVFYFTKSQKEEKEKIPVAIERPKRDQSQIKKEETVEIKKEEKDEKEEKKEEKKVNVYTSNISDAQNYAVEYPQGWQAHEIKAKNEVGFLPPSKTLVAEYIGDITISYKKNEEKLPIERFYDGINDVNLFEDAQGGFEKLKVAGFDAYKFKNVVGYVLSTKVVIILDKAFVEITDVYNKHQQDGVFDEFVKTFRVSEAVRSN